MTEVEILELTYFDLCTIKRKLKVVNPETGVTTTELKTIAENVKCALSKRDSVISFMKSDGVGKIISTDQLFISPNVDIKEGDTVEVTSLGKTTTYLASEPFHYPSHSTLFLTERKRV